MYRMLCVNINMYFYRLIMHIQANLYVIIYTVLGNQVSCQDSQYRLIMHIHANLYVINFLNTFIVPRILFSSNHSIFHFSLYLTFVWVLLIIHYFKLLAATKLQLSSWPFISECCQLSC